MRESDRMGEEKHAYMPTVRSTHQQHHGSTNNIQSQKMGTQIGISTVDMKKREERRKATLFNAS